MTQMTSRSHVVNVVATILWPVCRKDGPHGGRPTGPWLQRFMIVISLSVLMAAGCNKNSTSTARNSNKVRVGYIGLTCEAPIYVAYEKGFFKEEGLEPELVRCNWATYKDALALGSYDITHHLVMYFLKPIEQGLDVRFLAGIHRGCLRVQAGVKTNIHTIGDLKGTRIGVPGMGTPPFVFANPDTAARATRALLKGAKWVETNPRAAAVMAVEKKYLASTPELNTAALARLRYIPSVQLAEESVHTAGREMKVAKMLSPETNTEALAKRAFMHLPGVTDEWIKTLEVEKVAGGQVSPDEDIRLIAELIQKDRGDSCCRRKMFDQPDQDAPNLADPDAPCLRKDTIAGQK